MAGPDNVTANPISFADVGMKLLKNCEGFVENPPYKFLGFVGGFATIGLFTKWAQTKISDRSTNVHHKNGLERAALRDRLTTQLQYEGLNQFVLGAAFLATLGVLIAKIGLYLNAHLVGTVIVGIALSALTVVVVNSVLARQMGPVGTRSII